MAQRKATSDFERQVLADGKITRAEYQEAVNRYVQCMKDKGLDVETQDQFGTYIYVASNPSSAFDKTSDTCSTGTKALVEPLYAASVINPRHQDLDTIEAQCFVRRGVVPAPFSASDLRDLLKLAEEAASRPGDGEAQHALELTQSENGNQCLANPSYDLSK